MLIISFAWTTPALVAGFKTCTRRDWLQKFAERWHKGTMAQAYDKSPRFKGVRVGHIELVRDPYRERTCDIPDEDYEAEGFGYMERNNILIRGKTPRQFWDAWRDGPGELWVVRFRLVDTCPQPVKEEKQIRLFGDAW